MSSNTPGRLEWEIHVIMTELNLVISGSECLGVSKSRHQPPENAEGGDLTSPTKSLTSVWENDLPLSAFDGD